VKRDDCTGLAMGGNKARQLEFYFGEAREAGADTVLVTGAVQSNYVRSTAAAAAKLGMRCVVQLEERVAGMGETYHRSGNVLLNEIFGCRIVHYPEGEDEAGADRSLDALADEVRMAGGRPYVIHLSAAYPPLGALGYVEAASEILAQAAELGLDRPTLITPSGSAATHGGLLVGLALEGRLDVPVIGMCVRRNAQVQRDRVIGMVLALEDMLEIQPSGAHLRVDTRDDTLPPGYGRLSTGVVEAIRLMARTEGLVLDPVYTGRAFAGLVSLVRSGELGAEDPVIFVHTGGTPAVFGYAEELTEP
jgi:1-aminocyclopropane-1-carboxylate deaminase/D-cysteine desulfhydrase-like pyridoxal-dependent ACC family enzyme